jgi:CheY-like chemotaxis protein
MIRRVTPSVLIVEDDPGFRALAARLLAASRLTVIGEADSVSGAFICRWPLKPSAFLVDAELPDGDGITLARETRALPWRPRIVLTSIDRDIVTANSARSAGATAFGGHPSDPDPGRWPPTWQRPLTPTTAVRTPEGKRRQRVHVPARQAYAWDSMCACVLPPLMRLMRGDRERH